MTESEAKEVAKSAKWIKALAALFGKPQKANRLVFVRTTELQLIPRRLFKCVRDRVFDDEGIDLIYQAGGIKEAEATSFLYLMIDPVAHEIHGILWMNVDFFSHEMGVFLLAVDPEYRSSNLPTLAAYFLFGQPFDWTKIRPVINFSTTRPKGFERLGCTPGPFVQMSMTKERFEAIEKQNR